MDISVAIIRSGTEFRHKRADKAFSWAPISYSELRQHLAFNILMEQYEWALVNAVNAMVSRGQLPCSVAIVVQAWVRDPARLEAPQRNVVDAVLVWCNKIRYARKPWMVKKDLPPSPLSTSPTSDEQLRPPTASRTSQTHGQARNQSTSPREMVAQPPTPSDQAEASDPLGGSVLTLTKRPAVSLLDTILPKKAASTVFSSAGTATFSYTATGIGSTFDTSKLPEKERIAIQALAVRSRIGLLMDYPLRPPLPARGKSFKCPYCCQVLQAEYLETRTKWR